MIVTASPSPNYTAGRAGLKPFAIVNHITDGYMPGCLVWLQNPLAQASSHYLIDRLGGIYKLVDNGDTAWANGAVLKPSWPLLLQGINPNLYTLSIEHEARPGDEITEAQYQASLWLHGQLCDAWGIPRDRQHIIGHNEIDSVNRVNDPGPNFPWQRLITDLNAQVRIRLDGAFIDTFAKIEDGRTLVHVRFAEHLGYVVQWDEANRIVDVTKA